MTLERGELDVEDLLKIVLGLIAVYLALKILDPLIGFVAEIVSTVIVLVIALMIVLWLLDRL
ncbi:DUF7554 family protein [Halovivax limisalsi]|uniref:DUF7554 family protein n=1 Tax=Halovivax limisalsi TaxID=1453760 RepID=UPI001FFD1DDB|nr:hypothetical protein [Halovivax limisalsi]